MKRIAAIILTLALLCGLSSCSLLQRIKEFAIKPPIQATPAADEAASLYSQAYDKAWQDALSVEETVRISVGKPQVEGEGEIALLQQAAVALRDLMLSSAPGESDSKVRSDEKTLLSGFVPGRETELLLDRNYVSEKVTDEKGSEVTDEAGEGITETHIANNILTMRFQFYTASGSEEGSAADASVIESVFGAPREKDEILSEFDKVKNYFTDVDYSFAYTDPAVTAVLDMDEGRLDSVTFDKNIRVTARAKGAGVLASVGEISVSFDLSEKTAYVFHYYEEE